MSKQKTTTSVPVQETADQAYQRNMREFQEQLAILQQKFKRHQADQAKDPNNWGYAGDLAHFVSKLKELNQNEE